MGDFSGCGGRICRALRWRADKFDCVRYADDGFGGIDMSQEQLSYKLCGRICGKVGKASSGSADIPGRSRAKNSAAYELTVIASSDRVEIGDVVSDGNYRYRIAENLSDDPIKYVLERLYEDFDGNAGA